MLMGDIYINILTYGIHIKGTNEKNVMKNEERVQYALEMPCGILHFE